MPHRLDGYLVTDSEVADTHAKKVAKDKIPDNEGQKSMEGISIPFLKRRAAEKSTRQWREHNVEHNKRKRTFKLPGPNSKPRMGAALRTTTKTIVGRFHQLLSGNAMMAPFLKDKWKWVDSGRCW